MFQNRRTKSRPVANLFLKACKEMNCLLPLLSVSHMAYAWSCLSTFCVHCAAELIIFSPFVMIKVMTIALYACLLYRCFWGLILGAILCVVVKMKVILHWLSNSGLSQSRELYQSSLCHSGFTKPQLWLEIHSTDHLYKMLVQNDY